MKQAPPGYELAHYTIAGRDTLERALANGGRCVLEQGARWSRAEAHHEAARVEGRWLPLLLGDAGYIIGVEWTGLIERIEHGIDGRTLVHVTGLRELSRPFALSELIKLSDGRPLDAGYRHGNVACYAPTELLQRPRFRIRPAAPRVVAVVGSNEAEAEVAADPQCKGIPETTRVALVNARIGQGQYRRELLELWGGRCALTGCAIERVLVASHAKPWAVSTNEERLDKYNGLLLAASVDRLFDAGLISFADDGKLLAKPEVSRDELRLLGVPESRRLRVVHRGNLPYLAEHRRQFGFENTPQLASA